MLKLIILKLIKLYQQLKKQFFPNSVSCRFSPTCSDYSYQAVEKYGIIKGIYLGLKRLSRCHPLNQGGVDNLE
jgi:hypothetical protein